MRLTLLATLVLLPLLMVAEAHGFEPVSLPDAGNPEWVSQCGQDGGYEACENLADQHLKGLDGVPKDKIYTGYYLLKACRYGNIEMCEYATGMVIGEDSYPIDDPRAFQIFQEAMAIRCMHDDPLMCIAAAATFEDEDKAHYDPDYAGNSYFIGCERGFASACLMQGLWFSPFGEQEGVGSDAQKSLLGYRRACISEAGDDQLFDAEDVTFSCYMSYHFLKGGEGVPAEPEQAEHALYRSCDYGDGENCELAASSFHHGVNSVQKNPVSARAMAKRGCELDHMGACALEGVFAYYDEDYTKSFNAYKKACDADTPGDSCSMAAVTAYSVFGPKHQTTTDYAKRGCDTGDGWACFNYASNSFWLDGDNFNREIYARSCSLGYQAGCDQVQALDETAAYNEAIDRRNEQMIADLQRPSVPNMREPTLGEQIQALGNSFQNWKPSYCSNSSITSRDGLFTTRPECAN